MLCSADVWGIRGSVWHRQGWSGTHQEGTEHVEADEVKDGEAAAAGVIGFRGVGWL